MRNWINLVEEQEDDYEDEEVSLADRSQTVLDAVAEFARPLPIRVEMMPFRNLYTKEIQGVVLTDFYADTPGEGAGSKVMNFMIAKADELGVNIYTDPEGPRSKAFYEKFGFTRTNGVGHMMVHYPPMPDWFIEH